MAWGTSPAKNGTLGSQTGINDDEIIFDTAMTTNNGGVTTTTFPGKNVTIRRGTATEEVAHIVSVVSGNKCKVNKKWATNPASGDAYEISYVAEDGFTAGDFDRVSNTNDWYVLKAQLSYASTFYLALVNGVQIDTADVAQSTTDGPFDFGGSAILEVGYPANSEQTKGMGGAQINTRSGGSGGTPGNQFVGLETNARLNWYAANTNSVESTKIEMEGTGTKIRWVDCIIFASAEAMDLVGTDVEIINSQIQGVSRTQETITVDEYVDIDGLILSNTNGFIVGDTSVETIKLRDVTFVGNLRLIQAGTNKTWDMVNPVWEVDTADQNDISFNGTSSVVNERYSLDVYVTDLAQTALSGATVYIYEDTQTDQIDESDDTDTDGYATFDVLKHKYEDNTTTITKTTYGGHVLKVYQYGYLPFMSGITMDRGREQPVPLADDDDLNAADKATALTNGSGITLEKHGTGETDPRPMKVMNYDNGTGAAPNVGETITGGTTTATGVVVEVIGNSEAGTLVLDTWNGTEFNNNETLTGNQTSFSAQADVTGFYEEFTWQLDCNNNRSLQALYDWELAKLATWTTPAEATDIIEWGQDEHARMVKYGASGFYTQRCVGLTEGVFITNYSSGTLANLQADDGTIWYPPNVVTVKVTCRHAYTGAVIEGARVLVRAAAGGPMTEGDVIMNELTDQFGVAQISNFKYTTDQPTEGFARKGTTPPTFKTGVLSGTITSAGLTIDISLVPDS